MIWRSTHLYQKFWRFWGRIGVPMHHCLEFRIEGIKPTPVNINRPYLVKIFIDFLHLSPIFHQEITFRSVFNEAHLKFFEASFRRFDIKYYGQSS